MLKKKEKGYKGGTLVRGYKGGTLVRKKLQGGKQIKKYAGGGLVNKIKPTNRTSVTMSGAGAAQRGTTIKV
tara:strand:+ start:291 stop:503 length:213 start_codon:yes stop_codon:yes gene_type:complete